MSETVHWMHIAFWQSANRFWCSLYADLNIRKNILCSKKLIFLKQERIHCSSSAKKQAHIHTDSSSGSVSLDSVCNSVLPGLCFDVRVCCNRNCKAIGQFSPPAARCAVTVHCTISHSSGYPCAERARSPRTAEEN